VILLTFDNTFEILTILFSLHDLSTMLEEVVHCPIFFPLLGVQGHQVCWQSTSSALGTEVLFTWVNFEYSISSISSEFYWIWLCEAFDEFLCEYERIIDLNCPFCFTEIWRNKVNTRIDTRLCRAGLLLDSVNSQRYVSICCEVYSSLLKREYVISNY
jgi:hypothetical protein